MNHLFPPGAIGRVKRGPLQGSLALIITEAEFNQRYLGVPRVAEPDANTLYWRVPDGVIQRRALGVISPSNLERMTVVVTHPGNRRRWYFANDAKAREFVGDPRCIDADQYILQPLAVEEVA